MLGIELSSFLPRGHRLLSQHTRLSPSHAIPAIQILENHVVTAPPLVHTYVDMAPHRTLLGWYDRSPDFIGKPGPFHGQFTGVCRGPRCRRYASRSLARTRTCRVPIFTAGRSPSRISS
jgi:hypothetical protein